VPAESLLPGDRILVRPGEKIAADGKVLSGSSAIDRSSMTGESIPVDVEVGDTVSAGTLNLTGSFEMIAEKVAADTALSKMIALVEQASAGKAPVGRLADKVASVFVPTVMTIALLAAAAWLFLTKDFQKAFEVGVSVLVIACPCSLGLATPAAIMAGTGKAAERGILFRSAAALENCGKVDTVVFDKTGTLTSGNLEATEIIALEKDEKELLAIAYALEARSEHPIARAILKKGEQEGITPNPCADFEALPGRGVRGTINGKAFAAGSQRQLSQSHPALQVPEWLLERLRGKTAVFLLEEGRLLGAIGLFDTPKADSKTAVESLKSKGITCIMLSGDRKETAELTGKELGIDRVISEVLPEEKQLHVAALKKEGRTVAMVGDGINDAPSLAAADMGIALGSGTDVAIESADTVLMNDSVLGVYDAIALSSKTLRIIKQNLFFAFFYNSIGITLAVLGLANPMIGAAAMSLSSFCVLSNALRLRHFKSKSEGKAPPKKENQLCTNACPVSQNGQAQNDRSFNDRSQNNETQKENNEMEKTLKIEGMMCPKCVAHVKNALEKVEGVTSVTVSLEKKNAVVSGSADAEALKNAVIEEGYEVLSVE
jgi:heavy metal translocating P-type ATPase